MKKLILSVMLSTVVASSVVLAKPQSSVIDFGNGSIPAAGSYTLPLSKLVPNIHYNLTCAINNPSAEGIIMGVAPSYLPNPTMTPGVNTFEMNNITSMSGSFADQTLLFTNSDQDYDLEIVDCKAVAVSQ